MVDSTPSTGPPPKRDTLKTSQIALQFAVLRILHRPAVVKPGSIRIKAVDSVFGGI